MSRRFVWSDPKIRALARNFVCVADEVERIDEQRGPAQAFIRRVLKQAPRAVSHADENTFQGTYLITPDGRYLAGKFGEYKDAKHSRDSTMRLLRQALIRWRSIQAAHVRAGGRRAQAIPRYRGPVTHGLRLRVHVRDLPRGGKIFRSKDPEAGVALDHGWNLKWIHLTPSEALTLLPRSGLSARVPAAVFRKLTHSVTVDYVHDQGHDGWWDASAVKQAWMTTRILRRTASSITIKLSGRLVMQQDDQFGYDGHWLGRATYDLKRRRFTRFELVSIGMRMTSRKLASWLRRSDPTGLVAPMGLAYTIDGP